MQSTAKPIVILGLVGSVLDAGLSTNRWNRWRPSVALCQQEQLLVERFELMHDARYRGLALQICEDIHQISPETQARPHLLEFQDPWNLEEVYQQLYDFARSYPFRPEAEDYLVHITTGTHIAQICMYLLTESRHFPARLVQASPPTRRGPGPAGNFTIIDLDLSRYDRIASRFHTEQLEGLSFLKSGINTQNAEFNRLIERIEYISGSSKDPLLLIGPTGSGKSQLAKRIYELKRARRKVEGPFVEVNCATLRGDNAMSTLFGHIKGAFTGALAPRAGMLKQAHRGVLFLDELGELGPDEQAMLLRAIEEKSFFPLGSDKASQSEFQLIAGTNRDLALDIASGKFREDLLARINLWTFELPGLRERPEDIEPNLEYELEHCSHLMNRRLTMSREARALFLSFASSSDAPWSGNFRDFNAAIRRMATLAPGGRIGAPEVEEEIQRLKRAWRYLSPLAALQESSEPHPEPGSAPSLSRLLSPKQINELDPFDQAQLEAVVNICLQSTSLSEAGRALFRVSRSLKKAPNDADRLRKYLARFNLDWASLKALKAAV